MAVGRVELARWSLTPSWSRELKIKFPTVNARSEGITDKATWRGPVKTHRALIPVTGYYEWQTDPTTKKKKTPFYIHSATDEVLAFAGLYSWWKDPAKAAEDPTLWTLTATILTSSAVDELLHIHDRNPVPLPRDWWDDWLDPDLVGDQHFVDAAIHAALPVAAQLDIIEVAPLPPNHDGADLILPVTTDLRFVPV
ncbi:SOS response-associated peptidase [Cryobacterium sp. Y29]|uniref:SOS response-associated peptidase n=1 Tax=Cryobacterium sp. Y29 TaxID=2048285 RepID=UPI000CE56983|nr:SOS response-associated peptidase family protein [Cryobacterium sp. Y29]